MGMIGTAIESVARERARATCKIEKIFSEVMENKSDEAVLRASSAVYTESSIDTMTDEELDELINALPVDAEDEQAEIARMIASEDNSIDIDDILGINENL